MIDSFRLSHVAWRKSSRSGSGEERVEVADLSAQIAIRDSKNPAGLILILNRAEWSGFLGQIRHGRYDGSA